MTLFKDLQHDDQDRFSHDYGGMQTRVPLEVVPYSSDQDPHEIFLRAQNEHLSLTFRGAGRGCAGQSLSDGGILLERYERGAQLHDLYKHEVNAAASSNLCRLEVQLNENGLSLPVIPVYLNLSLGGVLSAGGLGLHSITHGQTVDHVIDLTFISPEGQQILVSPSQHEELFRHVLCGQGQLGMIKKATLKVVTYKPFTHFAHYAYDELKPFLKSLSWISSWQGNETLQFLGSIGLDEPHIALYGEDVESASSTAFAPWLQQGEPLRSYTEKDHRLKYHYEIAYNTHAVRRDKGVLYSAYCFPYEEFCEHAEKLVSLLQENDEALACMTRVPFYAIRQQSGAPYFPFSPRTPHGPSMLFGVGINWAVPLNNDKAWTAVKKVLDASLIHCMALGGKPYLGCWHDFNKSHLKAFYPEASRTLHVLKEEWDPQHLIATGQLSQK